MIEITGKVNKGIRNFWTIMTQDQAIAGLRGKTVKVQIIEVDGVKQT